MEKKNNNKNVVKKTEEVKNKSRKKISYDKLASAEKVLLGVFILLAILVCILGCLVITNKNKNRVIDKTNIVLPILEENTKDTLEIDAYGLTKERYYIIKVTNYHDKKKLEEDILYNIDIENETKATIKLTKNDDNTNLIKNNNKTVITGLELKKGDKQEDYYYLSIVHDGGVVKDDTIKITFSTKITEETEEESK